MRTMRWAAILFLLPASLACGASDELGSPAPQPDATPEQTDIVDNEPASSDEADAPGALDVSDEPHEEPAPALDGFDMSLEVGLWWEYAYIDESRGASQGGGYHSVDEGVYRIVLAPTETVAGVVAHPAVVVPVSGDPPRSPLPWDFVTVDGSTWLGSWDGGEFSAIYDTVGGTQAGGGFFDRFATNALVEAEPGIASYPDEFAASVSSPYLGGLAIVLRHSEERSRCVDTGSGTTVCGSDSLDEHVKEYFLADVGPLGRTFFISGSDGGFGFMRSVNIVLIDHGTGGTIPEDTGHEDESAQGYVRYTDETGTFAIGIPASWTAVQTGPQASGIGELPKIAAALDSSVGTDNWGVPGAVVLYFAGAATGSPDRGDWVERLAGAFADECTELVLMGEGESHHELQHSGCSSHQAKMRYLAFDVGNTSDRLLLTFQWVDEADFVHYQPIIDSIELL